MKCVLLSAGQKKKDPLSRPKPAEGTVSVAADPRWQRLEESCRESRTAPVALAHEQGAGRGPMLPHLPKPQAHARAVPALTVPALDVGEVSYRTSAI